MDKKTTLPRNTAIQIYDVVLVKLSKGAWAKLDSAHLPLIQDARWYTKDGHRTQYAVSDTRQKGERMHQTIAQCAVDHINNDGLDNRASNLRPCTTRQNGFNKRLRSDNSSGFKGVCRTRSQKKWRAYINIDGKQINLGTHETRKDAHAAYCEAAHTLHGEFANTGGRNG